MGSFKRLILTISVIIISVILIWLTQGGIIDAMIEPVRLITGSTHSWVSKQNQIYSTNQSTQNRLNDLELKNASLSNELVRIKEVELENERLRSMLKLPFEENKDRYEYVSALIIERSPNTWYDTFVIDKGSKDGIKADDVVTSPSGILGKVSKVTGEHTALVVSLSDVHNNISLINSRSRDVIIAQGAKDNRLKSKILYAKADMQVGDIMLSSGLGTIYPRYIPVAKIVKINKEDIDPTPTIEMEMLGYDKYWEQVMVFRPKTQ